MAPHATTNGEPNSDPLPKERVLTVLVTGFGPFQERYPINPSFEVAKSLPSTFVADGTKVHIVCYGTPVNVCYEQVLELAPVLHESYAGTVDLVLHLGMASGRDYYTAELHGHRDGYTKHKDLEGKTLPADYGLVHFSDCPPLLTTSLDFDEVVGRWKSNIADINGADCRPSEDAGHYLCDYIYFNSLAWFGRRNGSLGAGKSSDRPVLFLHVPAEGDPETLEKGKQVTLALIEAMVHEWRMAMNDEST